MRTGKVFPLHHIRTCSQPLHLSLIQQIPCRHIDIVITVENQLERIFLPATGRIVIPHQADIHFLHRQLNTFDRPLPIARQIAQADDLFTSSLPRIRQRPLERCQIAMYVTDDCVFHLNLKFVSIPQQATLSCESSLLFRPASNSQFAIAPRDVQGLHTYCSHGSKQETGHLSDCPYR